VMLWLRTVTGSLQLPVTVRATLREQTPLTAWLACHWFAGH
jgi:hypothetical protein